MTGKKAAFALIVFILLVLVISVILANNTSNEDNHSVDEKSLNETTNNFSIISHTISTDPISVIGQIEVKFNMEVSQINLNIVITPDVDFQSSFDPSFTELTIEPTATWNYNTLYKVTILKSTQSKTGQKLDKDYEFSFTTEPYFGL